MHRAVLDARAAADDDARDALRIALEQLSHALAALGEAEEVGDARTPKELARWLVDGGGRAAARSCRAAWGRSAAVPALDLAARADAAGGRGRAPAARPWRGLDGPAAPRVHPAGVVAWFDWPRPELGGATPRALLEDPVRLPDLLLAAGSTRSTAFA